MTAPRSDAPRAGLYAGLALAAAAVIGAAVGFALGRAGRGAELPGKVELASDMTLLGLSRARLVETLQLTPSQRVVVDSLLDAASRHAEAAVDTLMTGVRAVTNHTRRQIRSALDERQRARFDSLLNATAPVRMRTPVPPRRP